MDKTLQNLYYSSLLSESPSVRDSTSRHANRFLNSFEMSSMHLLPSNLINQSVFLSTTANDTFQSNTILEEPDEESFSSDSALTLYQQFFETNQKYAANEDNVFEMLTEFELLCCDHLMVTSSLMKSKVRHSAETKDMNKLEN
ncbi:unnamed protein product, partial [Oppiella nova]